METGKKKQTTENYIKEIRRKTRRIFNSEQKIAIVMEALRAEMSVAELCRKHSIQQSQFFKWNKEFLEAGKKRLSGDMTREATSDRNGVASGTVQASYLVENKSGNIGVVSGFNSKVTAIRNFTPASGLPSSEKLGEINNSGVGFKLGISKALSIKIEVPVK